MNDRHLSSGTFKQLPFPKVMRGTTSGILGDPNDCVSLVSCSTLPLFESLSLLPRRYLDDQLTRWPSSFSFLLHTIRHLTLNQSGPVCAKAKREVDSRSAASNAHGCWLSRKDSQCLLLPTRGMKKGCKIVKWGSS